MIWPIITGESRYSLAGIACGSAHLYYVHLHTPPTVEADRREAGMKSVREAGTGRGQRAGEAIVAASRRSPVTGLEAVARPGSVAHVSQDNGAEDARSARQRDILKT